MEQIPLAMISLSVGWGMHSAVAARWCMRCAARKFAISLGRFSQRPMPRFCMKTVLAFTLGILGMLLLRDMAEIFGWKAVLTFYKNMVTLSLKENAKKRG